MMMKPYRFAPPSRSIARVLERPRLLDALDGRFERRLTYVQGGAGFGKTTLLVDALDQNLSDAAGIDVWLGLSAEDDRLGELVAGIRHAMGIEPSEDDDLEVIVNAFWKESPRDIALVLDDLHYLRPGGASSAFIESLLDALPANGHLVLASREAPNFPIARLLASDEACVVEESELAFDTSERAQFLADRGLDHVAEDWGGWPALLALAATAGTDRVGDFVWEEVLGRLPPTSIQALRRLAPLDWIDEQRIRSVTQQELSLTDLLDDLPLVSLGPNGTARLHALWRPFLEQVDPAWRDGEFETALADLCRASDFREALKMCRAFERGDCVVDVVRALASVFDWSRFEATELETLIGLLPEEQVDSPCGRFLEGLRLLHVEPTTAVGPMLQAREAFAELGEASLELATLCALGMLAFFGSQIEAMRHFVSLGQRIDHPQQPLTEELGRATLAILEGRPEESLERIATLAGSRIDACNLDTSTSAIAALDAGRPSVALAHTEQGAKDPTRLTQPSLLNSRHDALWFEGLLDDAALAEFDGALRAEIAGHRHNTTVTHCVLALQNALRGRIEAARDHCERAAKFFDPGFGPRVAMALAAGQAAIEAASGDEKGAGARLARELADTPSESTVHRHSLRALGLLYVLVPGARPQAESWSLGPCFRGGLAAAQALVTVREQGTLEAAANLDWADARRFLLYLTPAMNLELAVAATAGGCEDAEPYARSFAGSERAALRTLTLSDSKVVGDARSRHAGVVKDLLARVPARPARTTKISVLGPLALTRDDAPVDHPHFRRSRVRDLLRFLIAHRDARRVDLTAALWPEMDDKTAASNLRVNLSHLLKVLEPDRKGNEPSFFIDLEGERVSLRSDDALVIDAERFDQSLDRAERLEGEGRIREALEAYHSAIELYRGDYLGDAGEPHWGEIERTRLRSRYVTAALRTASLLIGKSDFATALELTRRVLEIDDLRESAYRLQALAYFRTDDRLSARRVLETGRERFVEAGLEPGEALLHLLRRAGGR